MAVMEDDSMMRIQCHTFAERGKIFGCMIKHEALSKRYTAALYVSAQLRVTTSVDCNKRSAIEMAAINSYIMNHTCHLRCSLHQRNVRIGLEEARAKESTQARKRRVFYFDFDIVYAQPYFPNPLLQIGISNGSTKLVYSSSRT
jgi:hypothetical protein